MKELKIIAIATIVTILLIVGCAYATAEADPNLADFYPETAVVTELDYQLDKVSCVTYAGHKFEFYGCYDWSIGDICSLYMWTCGTLNVEDDEVLDVEYGGTLSPVMVAEWLQH